nr:IS4 family transposase [uncultured Carboxylicivirga sp.]
MNYELDTTEFHRDTTDGREKKLFVRKRELTLKNVILLIMSLQSAVQRDLDRFFTKLNSSSYTIRKASKGAFSQARAKINEKGFIRLNRVVINTFYRRGVAKLWKNHRLIGVDGTRLMLPNHPTIKEEFGTCKFGPKSDSERSMATGSMLFDVLNQLTLDARLSPYKKTNGKSAGERALLQQHLPSLEKGDLLIMDRGYPSIALFFMLIARGVDFCARMKTGWWKVVREFRDSGAKEQFVEFSLPKSQRDKLKEFPEWTYKIIKCRLIRVELEHGEVEILCTSLTDIEKYPHNEFKELYHLRWNHEEAYKLLKNRIELEDFSGKTANAVKQDFHAKIFLLSLTAAYAHPIEERVREEFRADEKRKHSQKINRTNAIAATKDILIAMFVKRQYCIAINAFDEIVYRTRELIRPNRLFERKKKPKKSYSMNYKRL